MQTTQTSFYHWSSHLLFLLLLCLSFRPSFTASVPPTNPEDNISAVYYDACANSPPFNCGGIKTDIKYPFRTPDQQPYCGHPDFELTCDEGNIFMSIQSGGKKYHVMKEINYEDRVLQLMDFDLLSGDSCPGNLSNTTFDFSLFAYPDGNQDTNLTLFLDCNNPLPPSRMDFLFSTQCSNEFFGSHSYFTLQSWTDKLSLSDIFVHCPTTVLLPVSNQNFTPDKFRDREMNFSQALTLGFSLTWTVGKGWCDYCTKTHGICGSNTNGSNPCFCPAGTTKNGIACNPSSPPRTGTNYTVKRIIIGVLSGVAAIVAACCLWLFYTLWKRQQQTSSTLLEVSCWHRRTSEDQTIETFLQKHGTLSPKRYSYLEVKKMTKSFHHKLGEGGFGSVFQGNLSDGHAVAVKLLNNTKGDDGEEFLNEVASIGRTSHVNIVSLLGFCFQGSKRALIYDFMPNGSLEKYIYAQDPKAILGWEKLFQIAVGIARGLEYLHRGCNTRIVHFDIKPHNILLDEDFCPKISDFGLAKFGTHKESMLSMAGARGTIGYIAPEVFSRSFGVVSSKSDVYSYGMMVLEMAGGRKNVKVTVDKTSEVYFPHWIYEHIDEDECMEQCGVTADTQEIARKLILVGLWCIQTRPESRPTMTEVVEMLEGNTKDLELPPKPYLYSPPRSPVSLS